MTLTSVDITILLGFNSKIKPWDHFENLVLEKTEPTDREYTDLEKKIIEMYQICFNKKILDYKLCYTQHNTIKFLYGDLHAITEDGLGIYITDDTGDYLKYNTRLKMEIFNIDKIITIQCLISENNVSLKLQEHTRSELWFSSIVNKIIRFQKEIDIYSKYGLAQHPIHKIIGSWNVGDKIPVDEILLEMEKIGNELNLPQNTSTAVIPPLPANTLSPITKTTSSKNFRENKTRLK